MGKLKDNEKAPASGDAIDAARKQGVTNDRYTDTDRSGD